MGKVQRPEEARSIAEVPMALDWWQAVYREYIESGGRWMPFEDKRLAVLQLLPARFREDMFMKLPELQDSMTHDAPQDWQDVTLDRLRIKVQTQAQQIAQWSDLCKEKERPMNSLESDMGHQHAPEGQAHDQAGHEDFFLAGKKAKARAKAAVAKVPCRAPIAARRSSERTSANCPSSPGPSEHAIPVARRGTCHSSALIAKGRTRI